MRGRTKSFRTLLPFMLVMMTFLFSVHPVVAAASAVVQNDSTWIDPLGVVHVFGEVKNTGDVWLSYVEITGTLRDSSNAIVDIVFTFTVVRYLPPDSVASFDLLEIDTAESARVQTYSLVVEFQEAPAISQKLVIVNTADSKNSLGWLDVVGEVENQGSTPSTYTKVVGTFYDATGKVVYSGFTFTSPSEIPAGARYGFNLTVASDERTGIISRYSLIAESENSGYTSVPELSTPMYVAGIVLFLGIVTIRRRRHPTDD